MLEWDDNKAKVARLAGVAAGLGANNINIMAMFPKSKLQGAVEMRTKQIRPNATRNERFCPKSSFG